RGDFAPGVRLALQAFHDQGCALPLVTQTPVLPPTAALVPTDLLPLLGRTINVVSAMALRDPDGDVLAIAHLGTDPYQLVARRLSAGPINVNPAPWEALKCDTTSCTAVPAPAGG